MASRRQQATTVQLPERFTVETAAAVLAAAAPRIRSCRTLRIDMTDVAAADTAGLQLLAVVRGSLLAEGKGCEIGGASASVRDSVALLGLEQMLELA